MVTWTVGRKGEDLRDGVGDHGNPRTVIPTDNTTQDNNGHYHMNHDHNKPQYAKKVLLPLRISDSVLS